ncbi:GNAT family N-acetyltransferase [Candidatus Micrarchaeota archaeon]|nr:GNAT family N-acetyltransferase [Candidatus Micrarchaeota archaeon]
MIDFNQLRIGPLRDERTVNGFHCGNEDLDGFLVQDAWPFQQTKLAATYLCFHQHEVVGYVALTADSVRLAEEEKRHFLENKARLHEFPAVKIARLAVKASWQRQGIGSFLVRVSLGKLWTLSESIGCRFATVDAKPGAQPFYEAHGFVRNLHKQEKSRQTVSMRCDLLYYKPA